jgi:hypothetical protein
MTWQCCTVSHRGIGTGISEATKRVPIFFHDVRGGKQVSSYFGQELRQTQKNWDQALVSWQGSDPAVTIVAWSHPLNHNLSLLRASSRKLRDFPCLRVTNSYQISQCTAIPLEYCSPRKHAFLVGRTQASDFLFFWELLRLWSKWFLFPRFLFRLLGLVIMEEGHSIYCNKSCVSAYIFSSLELYKDTQPSHSPPTITASHNISCIWCGFCDRPHVPVVPGSASLEQKFN